MIKLKKLFILLSACLLLQFSIYSEPSYTITESQLIELESLQREQEIQLQMLEQDLINYQEIIKGWETSYQTLEQAQLKKKVKIGAISLTVGLGVGALTTLLLMLNN